MMRSLATAGLAALAFMGAPAHAATVMDAVGDFLPSYTGSPDPDLDVTSFSVNYDGATEMFTLGATFAGVIDPSLAGLYVIGVNTGTGPIAPFGPIGQPNVVFNQAIIINKDGTGAIGGTALDPAGITISGNMFSALVPLALLPSTGFAPGYYGFNIWPRDGVGGPVGQISDFAPENATLAAVPEPASWALMIAGFAVTGAAMRRRRSARIAAAFAA